MKRDRIVKIRLSPTIGNFLSLSTLSLLITFLYLAAKQQPDFQSFALRHLLWLLLAVVALILIHEAIHALSLVLLERLPLKAFVFGVMGGVMPYCHCKTTVSMRSYKISAMMPLILTSPVCLYVWHRVPSVWSSILAALSISGCMADVWFVLKMRGMPGDLQVRDCPDEAGCDVIEPTA